MILLLDIGNTHTHIGVANDRKVIAHADFPSGNWFKKHLDKHLRAFLKRGPLKGACLCSVVPQATRLARARLGKDLKLPVLVLHHRHLASLGMGIDYPKPASIGPDRLANAVAARHGIGRPSVVVDFGTAVTFDVINRKGDYAGGIIAPGLAAMTRYLHEKTALLPAIEIRDTRAVIGKSTEQAMLIGAVHGYRGLIRELISRLRKELHCRNLPVVATGGYARLLARTLPEIRKVDPLLTLEGLRLVWHGLRG